MSKEMMYAHETRCENSYNAHLLLEGELQLHYGNQGEYEDVGVQEKAAGSNRYGHVEGICVPFIHETLLPGLPRIWSLIVDTGYYDSRVESPVQEETEVNTEAKPNEGTKDL